MKVTFTLLAAIGFLSFSGKEKPLTVNAKYIETNLSLIPAGFLGSNVPDSDNEMRPDTKKISVAGFYMFKYEVSNELYLQFINDIHAKGDLELYKKTLPDTLVWRSELAFNEKYVDYYLHHPAYQKYPVVGVSYEQCEMFCDWLTNRYNADPGRKHKKVIFSLPDAGQRELASRGGVANAPYPWGGPYLRDKKGLYLANFRKVDEASMIRMNVTDSSNKVKQYYVEGRDETSVGFFVGGINSDVVAPVKSYFPNAYGLYNMSGNVEEYIQPKGKTMGGSWQDPGFYLQNNVYESYSDENPASSERGFRFVMKVISE